MLAVLDRALKPLMGGARPVPHSLEWLAQGLRYTQIFMLASNLVVSVSDSIRQLRAVMPYLNWIGMSRSDLSEGMTVYFSAFYGACAWTVLLGAVFALARTSPAGS